MAFKVRTANEHLIHHVANLYLGNIHTTLEGVADKLNTSKRTVSNLLFRGIAENILSNKISDEIFNKVVYANEKGQYQRRLRWERAFELREDFIQRKKDELKSEQKKELDRINDLLKEIAFQISSYDNYFYDEEGLPSKEDLVAEKECLEMARSEMIALIH